MSAGRCIRGYFLSLCFTFSVGSVAQPVQQLEQQRREDPASLGPNITDEERYKSKTFVNEALANKVVKEECAKLRDPAACQGKGRGTTLLSLDSNQWSIAAKALALLMGAHGVNLTLQQGGASSGKTCILIGAGGELAGAELLKLSAETLKTPVGGSTDQKSALYKAARAHKDKSKAALWKFVSWGAATACFAYKFNTVNPKFKKLIILFMPAAAVLSTYYFREMKIHKRYAKEVQKIAEKLPGPGDCNPVTQKDCYCSLEEYENDPKHCLPYLHKRKLSKGAIARVACTNEQLKADPQCDCILTDTCLDKTIKNSFLASGAGDGFLSSPIGQDALALTRGELRSGELTASPNGKYAGLSNFMRTHGNKIPPVDLNPQQASLASGLSGKFGVPLALSRHLVAAPNPPNLSDGMERLGFKGKKLASGEAGGGKKSSGQVWDFRGGDGLKGKVKKASSDALNWKKFLPKKKKKKKSLAGQILNFDDEALNKGAGLIQDSSKNIFHIISKRYTLWSAEIGP